MSLHDVSSGPRLLDQAQGSTWTQSLPVWSRIRAATCLTRWGAIASEGICYLVVAAVVAPPSNAVAIPGINKSLRRAIRNVALPTHRAPTEDWRPTALCDVRRVGISHSSIPVEQEIPLAWENSSCSSASVSTCPHHPGFGENVIARSSFLSEESHT